MIVPFVACVIAAPVWVPDTLGENESSLRLMDCRIVSQTAVTDRTIQCCDSCRDGMLLMHQTVQGTIKNEMLDLHSESVHVKKESASATVMLPANIPQEMPSTVPVVKITGKPDNKTHESVSEVGLRMAIAEVRAPGEDEDGEAISVMEAEKVASRAAPNGQDTSTGKKVTEPLAKSSAAAEEEFALSASTYKHNSAIVYDSVVCNTCITPEKCFAIGMRVNTWHRTCF